MLRHRGETIWTGRSKVGDSLPQSYNGRDCANKILGCSTCHKAWLNTPIYRRGLDNEAYGHMSGSFNVARIRCNFHGAGRRHRQRRLTQSSPEEAALLALRRRCAVPNHVFFGDTHLHTAFSMDAGAFGARLEPEDAYRFARGDEVESSTAGRAKLARPLDFLVVADHSDNMGFFPDLNAGAPHLLSDPTGKEWYDKMQAGQGMEVALEIIDSFSRATFPEAHDVLPRYEALQGPHGRRRSRLRRSTTTPATSRHSSVTNGPPRSRPGRTCTVWSSTGMTPARPARPFPATTYPPQGSTDPEYLWGLLQAYEDKTGGDVLAIAHNGNLSNGLMFPMINPVDNKPLTAAIRPDPCEVGAAL